jgi:hypothetical protein
MGSHLKKVLSARANSRAPSWDFSEEKEQASMAWRGYYEDELKGNFGIKTSDG